MGRADRAPPPAHRLPQEIGHRRESIIEVSTKHSPTGERYVAKPYPKDNQPRTFGVDAKWFEAVAQHIEGSSQMSVVEGFAVCGVSVG